MSDLPQTLFEKIWNAHRVVHKAGSPTVLYVDLHLLHEVTSPQAFNALRAKGLKVRRPDKTVATVDHAIPTHDRSLPIRDRLAANLIAQLAENCREFDILLYGIDSPDQGIVHVIGPELGLSQPGRTIVCGDSHTSTHGAFGALAFGIGSSEIEHVLATQCLLQHRPKTMEVRVQGRLGQAVTAKDIILALIAKIGVSGGTGYVLEYTGTGVERLSMDQRMTICNMSIECGARAGLIAPDDTTFDYLAGRRFAPKDEAWDRMLASWQQLPTDPGAEYDEAVTLEASLLEPMITYGTNPGMAIPISGRIPNASDFGAGTAERTAFDQALRYMDLRPGQPLLGQPVDVVFIGSCTNSRLSDLRLAARLIQGQQVAPSVRMLVVPGSQQVKRQAEAEGLDRVFKEAGAEWREAGCSMCVAMNGDELKPGQYAVSTSNRNFEGRQGKGGRTFLASPLTAAATALHGRVTDPRSMVSAARL